MELTTMKYHVDQNVAHIVFSRAEAANAVNPSFCKDLKAVMACLLYTSPSPRDRG